MSALWKCEMRVSQLSRTGKMDMRKTHNIYSLVQIFNTFEPTLMSFIELVYKITRLFRDVFLCLLKVHLLYFIAKTPLSLYRSFRWLLVFVNYLIFRYFDHSLYFAPFFLFFSVMHSYFIFAYLNFIDTTDNWKVSKMSTHHWEKISNSNYRNWNGVIQWFPSFFWSSWLLTFLCASGPGLSKDFPFPFSIWRDWKEYLSEEPWDSIDAYVQKKLFYGLQRYRHCYQWQTCYYSILKLSPATYILRNWFKDKEISCVRIERVSHLASCFQKSSL